MKVQYETCYKIHNKNLFKLEDRQTENLLWQTQEKKSLWYGFDSLVKKRCNVCTYMLTATKSYAGEETLLLDEELFFFLFFLKIHRSVA